MIQGIVQSEDPKRVTIKIDGGDVGFLRSEIAKIQYGQNLVTEKDGIHAVHEPSSDDLPYPRLFLKDGQIVWGSKIIKENDKFYVKKPVEGGGFASFGFSVSEVEKLDLWPPPSEEALEKDFRKLQQENLRYSTFKSPYHIISSAESSDLVVYFRALQRYFNDFLLTFFDLIDSQKPPGPLAVVIFSDYKQFLSVGGLPANTQIVGFYVPSKKTLFLYNLKETDMVQFQLHRAEFFEKKIGGKMNEIEMYHGSAKGKWRAYDVLEKYQNEIDRRKSHLESWARTRTIEVIRHEATHQLLHLFGIDSTQSYRGAWFSEGVADYMAPEDLGGVNQDRLMFLRAELDAGHTLMPLQYLMHIPSGKGVHTLGDQDYRLQGYAQSWTMVYFLMQKYKPAFFSYLADLKKQGKDFNADKDIALLEKHVGKPLPQIEKEFEPFLKQLMHNELDPDAYDFYRLIQRGVRR